MGFFEKELTVNEGINRSRTEQGAYMIVLSRVIFLSIQKLVLSDITIASENKPKVPV